MKLKDLLHIPGSHVWDFTQDTKMKDLSEAGRRVGSYLKQKQFTDLGTYAHTEGAILVSPRPPYTSRPVLIVHVEHKLA